VGGLLCAWLPLAQAGDGCAMTLLRDLGWQVEEGTQAQPVVHGGTPCQRGSIAQAKANGDLRLTLPQGFSTAQREQLAHELLQQPASICAYAFRLGDAARTAAHRLESNAGYRFSALQTGWIAFGLQGAKAQGWESFRSFGRGYAPAGGNARAVDAFYEGRVRSECGVGRQIAQIATLRELYGDALFDAEFSPGELSIGTFLTLHDTDSILLGRNAGEFSADGKAVRTAAMGRQAFMGLPGFITHVHERIYLDDVHNQAENFIITDLSDAAAQALAQHGGFAYYDAQNLRVWEMSRQLQMERSGWRYFERLLHERDAALRAKLAPEHQVTLRQLDALLADPVYRELMIYVHPKGVRPLGYHIVRLLDRNPRTPFSIDLTLHNLHTTLYQRWIGARLRACAASTSSSPTP